MKRTRTARTLIGAGLVSCTLMGVGVIGAGAAVAATDDTVTDTLSTVNEPLVYGPVAYKGPDDTVTDIAGTTGSGPEVNRFDVPVAPAEDSENQSIGESAADSSADSSDVSPVGVVTPRAHDIPVIRTNMPLVSAPSSAAGGAKGAPTHAAPANPVDNELVAQPASAQTSTSTPALALALGGLILLASAGAAAVVIRKRS